MSWVRASEYAEQIGVCKKTAVRMAQRAGFAMEKRPVRGGWAWFVDVPGESRRLTVTRPIDAKLLEQCISIALRIESAANLAAQIAVKLYRVL